MKMTSSAAESIGERAIRNQKTHARTVLPQQRSSLSTFGRSNRRALDLIEPNTIYAWTKKNLQDPADGLFWDNLSLDGRIGKAKFSYNTALMLRTACELYSAAPETTR